MADKKEKKGITEGNLSFYFDGQEKNAIDCGRMANRIGTVLSIRDRLLGMHDQDFEVAVSAIDKIIRNSNGDNRRPTQSRVKADGQEKQLETLNLVESATGTGAATAVSAPAQVDKI